MNCKNCIHFNICEQFGTFDNGIGENTLYKPCKDFKDKARFVELPSTVIEFIENLQNAKSATAIKAEWQFVRHAIERRYIELKTMEHNNE